MKEKHLLAVTPLTLLQLLCYVVSLQLSPSNNFARIQPYLHTSLKKLSGWESEDEGEEQKSSHGAQGKDKRKSVKTAKLTS